MNCNSELGTAGKIVMLVVMVCVTLVIYLYAYKNESVRELRGSWHDHPEIEKRFNDLEKRVKDLEKMELEKTK